MIVSMNVLYNEEENEQKDDFVQELNYYLQQERKNKNDMEIVFYVLEQIE